MTSFGRSKSRGLTVFFHIPDIPTLVFGPTARRLLTPLLFFLLAFTSRGIGQVINEVVTDPQRDWNDSSGGNGVAFDDSSGSGSTTATDEWVELFNNGAVAIDLTTGTGWTLELKDGTDATLNFASPGSEVFVFSNGGSLSNFKPGEYLVIGNPPGNTNNDVYIVLKNQSGAVIDDVELGDDDEGDGNGDGAADGSGNGGNSTGITDDFFSSHL